MVTRLASYNFVDDGHIFQNTTIIDSDKQFGYISTSTAIVKVRLSDMRRESSLEFDEDVGNGPVGAAYDSANQLGYFAISGSAPRIVVVKLPELTLVKTIRLTNGSSLYVGSFLLDLGRGKAYIGSTNILKVDLTSGSVEATLALGASSLRVASFDTNRSFAFFSSSTTLYKIRLDTFAVDQQTTLAKNETSPIFGGYDAGTGIFIYFNFDSITRYSATDLSRIDSVKLDTTSTGNLQTGTLDNGTLYVGTYSSGKPNHVFKYRVSDFTKTGELQVDTVQSGFAALGIRDDIIFLGTGDYPSRVMRVKASTLAIEGIATLELSAYRLIDIAPLPNGKLVILNGGDSQSKRPASLMLLNPTSGIVEKVAILSTDAKPWALIADSDGSTVYVGETTVPARLSKYSAIDFSLLATKTYADISFFNAGTQDPVSKDLFLLPIVSSRKILRIRSTDLALLNTLELSSDDGGPSSVMASPAGGYLYALTANKLVKISLSNFSRVSAVTFPSGVGVAAALKVDGTGTYAYTASNEISRIRLSDLVIEASVPYTQGEGNFKLLAIDSTRGLGFTTGYTTPQAKLFVYRLSDLSRQQTILMDPDKTSPALIAIDSQRNRLYLGAGAVMKPIVIPFSLP